MNITGFTEKQQTGDKLFPMSISNVQINQPYICFEGGKDDFLKFSDSPYLSLVFVWHFSTISVPSQCHLSTFQHQVSTSSVTKCLPPPPTWEEVCLGVKVRPGGDVVFSGATPEVDGSRGSRGWGWGRREVGGSGV